MAPCAQVCHNNGTCGVAGGTGAIVCQCQAGFKGAYCQFEAARSSALLNASSSGSGCPAKWWGRERGICGPCACDEARHFSPDCDGASGECRCKDKFYRRVNGVTGEASCVPCDCYLEGSESLQCEQMTGVCSLYMKFSS